MREAASKSSSALAVASARMQELRRQELTLKNSMRELVTAIRRKKIEQKIEKLHARTGDRNSKKIVYCNVAL